MTTFTSETKATVVKETARTEIMTAIIEFLKKTYGDESVSIIGINTPVVAVGTWNDTEVCIEITATAKEIETKETEKTSKVPFNRAAAVKAFEADRTEKKANEEKRKAEREAKKAAKKSEE